MPHGTKSHGRDILAAYHLGKPIKQWRTALALDAVSLLTLLFAAWWFSEGFTKFTS